ncbi:SDR family oxidoreductase [Geoalkalibacter sp.]|uniref:SDR family oxidoreductase n=1 Tax=Geoalkalibacter sp. TaxID=3041440 RepID=UPI00272E7BBF|nr:SDR family oxidoreductase [Geoalkalibacter sp.]
MVNFSDVLIVGCGEIGRRVGRLWLERGVAVSALARSREAELKLGELGFAVARGDLDDPASLAGLAVQNRLVYYFAPPPDQGGADPRMEAFCDQALAADKPWKIVYISTSGVYGDCGGALVDETAPLRPLTDRARRRVAAEERLRRVQRERDIAVVILRVPGIYGPGRLPRKRIEQGVPVLDAREAPPSNRIHAVDLARICVAAGEKGEAGEVFNVCDESGGSMTDYFNAVADACGLPRPPQISMAEARRRLSAEMLSYLNESRRLDSRRLRERLGIELRYPDLAAGLRAALAEEGEAS